MFPPWTTSSRTEPLDLRARVVLCSQRLQVGEYVLYGLRGTPGAAYSSVVSPEEDFHVSARFGLTKCNSTDEELVVAYGAVPGDVREEDATKLRRAEVALEAQQRGDRQVTATLGYPACSKELYDAKWHRRSALRGLEDLPALEEPFWSC